MHLNLDALKALGAQPFAKNCTDCAEQNIQPRSSMAPFTTALKAVSGKVSTVGQLPCGTGLSIEDPNSSNAG